MGVANSGWGPDEGCASKRCAVFVGAAGGVNLGAGVAAGATAAGAAVAGGRAVAEGKIVGEGTAVGCDDLGGTGTAVENLGNTLGVDDVLFGAPPDSSTLGVGGMGLDAVRPPPGFALTDCVALGWALSAMTCVGATLSLRAA